MTLQRMMAPGSIQSTFKLDRDCIDIVQSTFKLVRDRIDIVWYEILDQGGCWKTFQILVNTSFAYKILYRIFPRLVYYYEGKTL